MADFDPDDYPEPEGYTLVADDELDDLYAKARKWDKLQAELDKSCPACGETGVCRSHQDEHVLPPVDPVIHYCRLGFERGPFAGD